MSSQTFTWVWVNHAPNTRSGIMRCWWKKWRGAAIVGTPICEWGGRTHLGFPLTPSGGIFTGKMEWVMMRIRSALMESIFGLVTFCLALIICSSSPFLSEVFVQHYCASRCLMFFIIKKKKLKGHSSQNFHCWPKCWGKPKMHYHQIWTFYV